MIMVTRESLGCKVKRMHISLRLISDSIHAFFSEVKTYHNIIQKFFIFACGAFITRSFTLLIAPITMHMLTPQDYGLLALANSFISILTSLLGFGLRQMLPLHYFQASPLEREQLITDIVCVYIVLNIPIMIILCCNIKQLNRYLFLDQAPPILIIISLCIVAIYFFVELFYQLLQYSQQAWHLTKLQIIMTSCSIAFHLFFLCIMRLGTSSVLLAQALGMLIISIVACKQLMHTVITHLSIKRAYKLLFNYLLMGLPFVPAMLCGLLLASGDRWILSHMLTMHHVGIYSVANTLAQCFNMISFYAITGSYMPYMLNAFANQENTRLLEQSNKRVMWAVMLTCFILLTVGFASCKACLYWCIPVHFHAAIDYMYMLLIGSIFLLGTYFLNCLIQFRKKNLFLGLSICLPAGLNILLNVLLIPYCQLHGCVLATLISYATHFIITYAYNVWLLK